LIKPAASPTPDAGVIGIAGLHCRHVPLPFPLGDAGSRELAFATVPILDEAVLHDARRELRRPGKPAGYINDPGPDRRIAVDRRGPCLKSQIDLRLGTCPEARASQTPLGTEHERRGQSSAIGDTTGRHQHGGRRGLGELIGDFGNQRERRTTLAMAAGFGALRDDDVGTRLNRLAGVLHRLDPADQPGA
jgi:hypothetical protein